MFVIANGVHNNALIFAKEVLLAGSNGDDPINTNLQKFLAIVIVTFVCQLLAFSRFIYIKISNLIAIFKISVLCFIVLLGFVAIDGARVHSSTTINTTYGKQNLSSDFGSRTGNPYQYSLAMLNIMRAFLGYENANFVLNEIRTGPKSDERRTFRRAVKIAVATICFLYVMVNFAFFAACTSEEIINQPETLIIFLEKIFGPSNGARLASSIIVSISAAGAILALTFANARVKQEIGRLGILPFPEFWCKTSHRRTPTRALLLHWIFTVLFIIIAPLDMSNGFAVISTFYSYVHTYISIMLGIALLCAPWLPSFQYTNREDGRFRPESSKLGYWLLGPLAIVYIATNFAVLALSWFPVNEQQVLDTTESTLPYFTGPVAALGVLAFGVVWWFWDRHVLRWLGYVFTVGKEKDEYSTEWNICTVHVTFQSYPDGLSYLVMPFTNEVGSSNSPSFQFLRGCFVSNGKDILTIDFHDSSFSFHAQWLHDAQCMNGSSRDATNAFCQQLRDVYIQKATIEGQDTKAAVAVFWDDGTTTRYPVSWLRVLAPIVAKQHGCVASSKSSMPSGWLVENLQIPQFRFQDIFSENVEHFDNVKGLILDNLLTDSAAGIIKISGVPVPDINAERSQKNNLVTEILKRIFGSVFQHPMRGTDETFKVTTQYKEGSARATELPNYDTSQLLLPHVDHAHYENPARIQGFYGLEGQSENTFVSGLAALATVREEDSDLFRALCTAPMAVGRVAQFYDPPLFQATVDTAVTMRPGSSDNVKRIRWHPHLTGSLLASFDTFGEARRAHQKFQEVMRRETHQLKVVLNPGDLYLWDNFRILHGRERVLEVPRTGIGQTVPEQVVADQYRAFNIRRLRQHLDEQWLVHLATSQLRDLVQLFENGQNGKSSH
ncbi:hypothetical protein MMC11_002579 [Xylographa trunciseda]|nr:hypothetical protein [Xylographa trunciseda]